MKNSKKIIFKKTQYSMSVSYEFIII